MGVVLQPAGGDLLVLGQELDAHAVRVVDEQRCAWRNVR
jgi:hypothetical protein